MAHRHWDAQKWNFLSLVRHRWSTLAFKWRKIPTLILEFSTGFLYSSPAHRLPPLSFTWPPWTCWASLMQPRCSSGPAVRTPCLFTDLPFCPSDKTCLLIRCCRWRAWLLIITKTQKSGTSRPVPTSGSTPWQSGVNLCSLGRFYHLQSTTVFCNFPCFCINL